MAQLADWVRQFEQLKAEKAISNRHSMKVKVAYVKADENDHKID